MKMDNKLFALMSFLLFTVFFTSSCINNITDDNSSTDGKVPVNVSSDIRNYLPVTRMDGESFETDDAIGLYLISQPEALTGARHLDNVRFAYNASGELVPETEVYYPYGEGKCDFYSYYPYREQGIIPDDSTLSVSVKTDQSKLSDYLASDFLVASVPDVTPTKEAVKLPYFHKMCKLVIEIVLKGEEDISKLAANNPELILLGLPTAGVYDFVGDTIVSQDVPRDISLQGTWKEKDGTLVGKSALLIPHTVAAGYKLLRFQVGSRSFSGVLSSEFLLQAGTVCTLKLTYDSQIGIKKMETSIEPWGTGGVIEMETREDDVEDLVAVSEADFRETNVLDVMHQDEVVAILCKEYLRSADVDAQAIVAYPVVEGKPDLEHGQVLHLLGNTEKVHGGTATWNKQTNELAYSAGTSSPYPGIYFDLEKKIVLAKPESPLPASLAKHYLEDVRGSEQNDYPIVKIGTQYWMRANLHTEFYADEADIPLLDETDITHGYRENGGYYYYNMAAVETGNLPPAGWQIPTKAQWDKLFAYVGGSASALKSGDGWSTNQPDLAGFNGEAVSVFTYNDQKTASYYVQKIRWVCYWQMEQEQECLFISEDEPDISYSVINPLFGLSVRCVQEMD